MKQQPTVPELAILKALWQQQPLAAKDIHDKVEDELAWSYSSTRKTLDRMLEKELVDTISIGNKKNYCAKVEKVNVLAGYVQDMAKRIFELDGPIPVAMFSESRLMNKDEIDDLENLLDSFSQDDVDNKNSKK